MFESRRKPDLAVPPPAPIAPDRPHAAVASARAGAVLSSGVSIKGDVTFRDELVVDGEVEGTIKSGGALIIGQHARISAEITAGSVTIQGTVNGNVLASERCAVEADATVRGDMRRPGSPWLNVRHFSATQKSGPSSLNSATAVGIGPHLRQVGHSFAAS